MTKIELRKLLNKHLTIKAATIRDYDDCWIVYEFYYKGYNICRNDQHNDYSFEEIRKDFIDSVVKNKKMFRNEVSTYGKHIVEKILEAEEYSKKRSK